MEASPGDPTMFTSEMDLLSTLDFASPTSSASLAGAQAGSVTSPGAPVVASSTLAAGTMLKQSQSTQPSMSAYPTGIANPHHPRPPSPSSSRAFSNAFNNMSSSVTSSLDAQSPAAMYQDGASPAGSVSSARSHPSGSMHRQISVDVGPSTPLAGPSHESARFHWPMAASPGPAGSAQLSGSDRATGRSQTASPRLPPSFGTVASHGSAQPTASGHSKTPSMQPALPQTILDQLIKEHQMRSGPPSPASQGSATASSMTFSSGSHRRFESSGAAATLQHALPSGYSHHTQSPSGRSQPQTQSQASASIAASLALAASLKAASQHATTSSNYAHMTTQPQSYSHAGPDSKYLQPTAGHVRMTSDGSAGSLPALNFDLDVPVNMDDLQQFLQQHQQTGTGSGRLSNHDMLASIGPGASNGSSSGFRTESDPWDEESLLFTPLLSPAMTPMSSFSQVGSSGPMPSHVSPAEFFSPLTSPALQPNDGGQIPSNLSSLSELVQQANAMGLGPNDISTAIKAHAFILQNPGAFGNFGSASGAQTNATSTGNGHNRGSSRSQPRERPSPMMNPVKRVSTKKKGARNTLSANASPALLPRSGGSSTSSPSLLAQSNASINGRSTPDTSSSPPHADGSNTPSPVDLEHTKEVTISDSMLPPPLPLSSSAMAPVTPASIMNFSANQMTHMHSPVFSASTTHDDNLIPFETSAVPAKRTRTGRKSASASPSLNPQLDVEPRRKGVNATSDSGPVMTSSGRVVQPAKSAVTTLTKAKRSSRSKASMQDSDYNGKTPLPDNRKTSHKAAEQKRRDSLKSCFDELRYLLPPIAPDLEEDAAEGLRRPGEGNVGGQRGIVVDPLNPNKGISKVALLRKSNEYIIKLHRRMAKRDDTIGLLRERVKEFKRRLGEPEDEGLDGIDFSNDSEAEEDRRERQAWREPDFFAEEEIEVQTASVTPVRRGSRSRRSVSETSDVMDYTL
ncbi:hypothetical protein E5Q_05987 [Mixia osmundae IAM 14324]|uniref:BHLH domain-containing protein n=1 Tax=Mixia osmundae (strain CBS 9802 / IAM 14324 / JCM 22182 / KY 12970) TaxID=764103 RepID=G7E9H3_MIXOS|nr:hypothetical protein E5Q_05987 [Mixia osmundae IAM 14324]